MDTLIYSLLRITVMFLILRTMFRLFRYPQIKGFRFKRERTVEDLDPNSLEAKNPPAETIEMVMDESCGVEIPRHRAYILIDENDQPRYFSTWDCRQRYIQSIRNNQTT